MSVQRLCDVCGISDAKSLMVMSGYTPNGDQWSPKWTLKDFCRKCAEGLVYLNQEYLKNSS